MALRNLFKTIKRHQDKKYLKVQCASNSSARTKKLEEISLTLKRFIEYLLCARQYSKHVI